MSDLSASPIRDILEIIDRPGMVSFAGGLPSPGALPEVGPLVLPQPRFQYGASEGEPELRDAIAADLRERGLKCTAEQVIILSGSQQGIDLTAKLFIDPTTPVAVEEPTYLAALQVFRFFGARLNAFDVAGQGALEENIRGRAFVYTIPTFQNPTGKCYSMAERARLAEACDRTLTPLYEDDPYRELAYDACDTRPVCAALERAPWIYQGSFSKSFAPGLRLGYLASSAELTPYFVRLKQAADLHSNRLSQYLVSRDLDDPRRERRIADLVAFYRAKRDRFAQALESHFEDIAHWETPPGGLFFWLRLNGPRAIDTRTLLPRAIERGVAFMPGEHFYARAVLHANALRLNFSHANEEETERGLAQLAAVFRESADAGGAAVPVR